ncbi:MAG: hypothetical protein NXY59_08750 [Aigarchaeota archaeon]|nr:hypothetical protein [Candidatus Pelearchaeum maunauluense]
MVAFHKGKATKPSSLKSPQDILSVHRLLAPYGFSIHVIDSEKMGDDIPLHVFDSLLRYDEENGGGLISVLTLPVRRCDFEERFQGVLEILRSHESGGLCLVAGNPAYLSEDEARRLAGRLLIDAVKRAKEVLGDRLIMVGSENMVAPAIEAARRFRAIPFALLNGADDYEIRLLSKEAAIPVAVYAPFYIGKTLGGDAETRLTAYALRRRKLRSDAAPSANPAGMTSIELVEQVALVGDKQRVRTRVMRLADSGAGVVVGFPASSDEEQLRLFSEAIP